MFCTSSLSPKIKPRNIELLWWSTYLSFGQCVSLGDDRDEVDLVLKPSEELEVDLPEAVAVRRDEVEAAVDPRVDDALPVQAALGLEVGRELKVDQFWTP